MPALEALLDRFDAAHTQPVGISVDSVHCHANWAKSLGGVSFPLLADFHPKGEVAQAFGCYLDGAGLTDRATVVVDAAGKVRYAASVGPGGKRDMEELAKVCEQIDAGYVGKIEETRAPGLPEDCALFVKSSCGFSRSVLTAVENLHLGDRLTIHNVSEDEAQLGRLKQLTDAEVAPCLLLDGKPLLESADIIKELVQRHTGLWS